MSKIMVFAGNSNPELYQKIINNLHVPEGNAYVGKFSDGEIAVEIKENVRGKDVFIVQSTSAPTNNHLMELMIMADALRRASAGRVTAVIPYFGYARQDRRPRSARVAISAKVVADMIANVGVNRILTVDLHADQIQGFFDIPVDNIYSSPVFLDDLEKIGLTKTTIVAPDHGGVVRARALAKKIHADLAIIDKRRPEANKAKVMNIIGDVQERECVLVDDMIDTGGTLCQAATALKNCGALKVYAYCTHPILSGSALATIKDSVLDELVVSNTIPLHKEALAIGKIRQIDMSYLIAESIRRISNEESISAMFNRYS